MNKQNPAGVRPCPPEIEAILPLIANGTFDLRKHPDIQKRLVQIPPCQEELKEFQALRKAMWRENEKIFVPEQEIFDKILSAIENGKYSFPESPFREKLKRWVKNFFPSPAYGIAFVMALLVIALQFGIITHSPAGRHTFQTLSGVAATPTNRIVLNVIFNPHAKMAALQKFFETNHGQIISGPGPGGVYQVSFPRPKNLRTFLKYLQRQRSLFAFIETKD